MSQVKPAPPNKRKKGNLSKIITDLAHITQDEFDSEPEASEFDLGNKIRTPRDIMLEELSLMNNKGSKMFRMRQKRVEKFIWENNPDVFSSESMDNMQKLGPSLGGQVDGCYFGSTQAGWLLGGGPPVPPPKPGIKAGTGAGAGVTGLGGAAGGGAGGGAGGAAGVAGAGGQGGNLQDGTGWTPLKGGGMDDPTNQSVARTYQSPWEKAMKGDESLTSTMRSKMAGPVAQKDLVHYKSFNRSAMPFGGYAKANMLMKFQLPDKPEEEPEQPIVYQHEIGCRPSFNRTPIGWLGSSELNSIHMETEAVPYDVETDDL
ncbi:myozenin-1a [Gadus chalcogrammus]|uniref:myozenin-1a n=1 Tax=Gadus chalcogrammus TaxID=1042646 RepID=UPI0024C4A8EA|nr:myozenin-1a [Gadus chalcogrammus]XP_056465519.1 myozenin-1a [Gadus chalcogrammus]